MIRTLLVVALTFSASTLLAESSLISLSSCSTPIRRISQWTNTYSQAVIRSDSFRAKLSLASVHRYLHLLERRKSPCLDSAANAYLLAAIGSSNEFSPTAKSDVKRKKLAVPQLAEGDGIYHIASFLILNSKLKPLTEQRRRQLGDWWLRKTDDGKRYRISGAYDCKSSVIYIDPYQGAFDVMAAFMHEMDHMFRDKLIDSDWLDLQMNEGKIDWRHFVLVDEVLAASSSAVVQAQKLNGEYIREGPFGSTFNHSPFRVEGDMTYFRPGGPIDQMVRSCGDGFETLREFLSRSLLQGEQPTKQSNHYRESMEVFTSLYESYYGQDYQMSLEMMDPYLLSSKYSPMALEFEKLELSPNMSSFKGNLMGLLARLRLTLNSPSRQCTGFFGAIKRGELYNYAGIPHVKPGESGVHPGESGVHPGESGVHPGESGVHPDEFGVRPCLYLQHSP